jgi:hypothetical protein
LHDADSSRPSGYLHGDCNAANDPAGGTSLVNAGKTQVAGIDQSGRIAPTRTLPFLGPSRQFPFGGRAEGDRSSRLDHRDDAVLPDMWRLAKDW